MAEETENTEASEIDEDAIAAQMAAGGEDEGGEKHEAAAAAPAAPGDGQSARVLNQDKKDSLRGFRGGEGHSRGGGGGVWGGLGRPATVGGWAGRRRTAGGCGMGGNGCAGPARAQAWFICL